MSTLQLSIVTPDGSAYAGEATSVTLPSAMGGLTILPHHAALLTAVVPGTVVVKSGTSEHLFAVTAGIAEVSGPSLRLLVSSADGADVLDQQAVEEAKRKAEILMKERRDDLEGFTEASATLDRELAKLSTLRRKRARRSSL